jgi:UDP-2,4-diacetamido-2,4,6-trideoxy-beta-L-altropyranose hydrolase
MKIAFRVDASTQMGTGHLMRCLTLAEALRGRGAQTRFICREHSGHLMPLLRQKAMPTTALPAPGSVSKTPGEDYAAWLGVTQAEDAAQTIEALDGEKPDWLVVDHYGLDVEWEQRLRPHVGKLMAIDDLANRHHDCDVLLDQNYSAERECRYLGLVPDACKLLVGPHYALLHPEYAASRRTLRARDGQVGRVLLFFGGSDPQNMTGMALEVLSQAELRHLEVDVVIGANNRHRKTLEKEAEDRPQTRIYGPRPHLADLMAQANLAIGAGGATTWERMCVGLPAFVVSIAENQRPACEALAEARLICYAGDVASVSSNRLGQLMIQLVHDAASLAGMSTRNQLTVDGLGAARLVEVLYPSNTVALRLRPATAEDITLYFNWVNDPEVRNNSTQSATVDWETHKAWFSGKINNKNSCLFVLEAGGLPVGQIRFDREGDEALIDYSIDPIVRGRGWGRWLVAMGAGMERQFGSLRLRAEVKNANAASRAVFLRLGFLETASARRGYVSFVRNCGGSLDSAEPQQFLNVQGTGKS